MKPAMNY